MTGLEILEKAGIAADLVAKGLSALGNASPDLKPKTDEEIAKLNGAIAPNHLIALAEVLPKELANIGQGKLDPRDHPSDLV